MSAPVTRFKRKPHVVIASGPSGAAIDPPTYSVELVDDAGRHRDIWAGPRFSDALAEALYLDCPIFLRIGAATEGTP